MLGMELSVDPVYVAIMLAACGVSVIVSRFTQQRSPLAAGEKAWLLFGAFCGAMLAAKAPYVLAAASAGSPLWFGDGKTILFGLVGGYFGVELVKWALHIKTKTGDGFAAPVAAGIAIGRLGCFRAQCCFGAPTDLPWGVTFPKIDDLARHPTQLYESAFHAIAAIILLWLQRHGLFRRQLIKLYFLAYFTYRFVTEELRPEAEVALGLTGYQWAAVSFAALFACLWIADADLAPKHHEEQDP